MSRLPAPIRPRGVRAARWVKWHAFSRSQVIARSHGHCESCGSRNVPLDWAHLAGRQNILGEPWASSPELTVALCRDCHNHIDRNLAPQRLNALRMAAVARLEESYGIQGADFLGGLDAIRNAVGLLETKYEFDPASNRIVKKEGVA